MPRRSRSASPTGFFHVVNHSVHKAPLFQRPRDYRGFLLALNEGLARYPVRLISYAVLSTHWHLVVGPVGTQRLSRLIQWVSATHAQRWHRRRNTVGTAPVYQGRFKSFPVAASAHLLRVCRYVERNALTAGLVRRAQDWPWCSLSERTSLRDEVPLVTTPFLTSDVWTEFVNTLQPGDLDEWSSVPFEAVTVEKSSVPLRDVAKQPGTLTGRAQLIQDGVRVGRSRDQDQTDAHVERAEHLIVPDTASTLEPLEDRWHWPTGTVELESAAVRQRAGKVLGDTATGDVRHPLDPARFQEGYHRMKVTSMRSKERDAHGFAKISDVTLNIQAKLLERDFPRQ